MLVVVAKCWRWWWLSAGGGDGYAVVVAINRLWLWSMAIAAPDVVVSDDILDPAVVALHLHITCNMASRLET